MFYTHLSRGLAWKQAPSTRMHSLSYITFGGVRLHIFERLFGVLRNGQVSIGYYFVFLFVLQKQDI